MLLSQDGKSISERLVGAGLSAVLPRPWVDLSFAHIRIAQALGGSRYYPLVSLELAVKNKPKLPTHTHLAIKKQARAETITAKEASSCI